MHGPFLSSLLIAGIALLAPQTPPSVDPPQAAQEPRALTHQVDHRVGSGRSVRIEVTLNTDGTFQGHFWVKNMQAAAGYHGHGHLDMLDSQGNILGRFSMPRLGVRPAFFAKEVVRVEGFGGALKPEYVGRVVALRSSGYENAGGKTVITELVDIYRELKRG